MFPRSLEDDVRAVAAGGGKINKVLRGWESAGKEKQRRPDPDPRGNQISVGAEDN